MKQHAIAAALLAALLSPAASRAETVQTCTGFITAVPTVISTQGTWCMDKDLATAIITGAAIDITTNNVTLDCNGFKLGNLAAGPNTGTIAVRALNRLNLTVRNCNLRGFFAGIDFQGSGGGHLIEDNRLDGTHYIGINVQGNALMVRGNSLLDTGEAPFVNATYGIALSGGGHVMDNTIDGLLAGLATDDGLATGLFLSLTGGGTASGNRITGVQGRGPMGKAYGIREVENADVLITDNFLTANWMGAGEAISCTGGNGRARDNFSAGFPSPIIGCTDDGGHIANP